MPAPLLAWGDAIPLLSRLFLPHIEQVRKLRLKVGVGEAKAT